MSGALPPYLTKILALEAAGLIPLGKTSHVEIAHDDWCPILTGTSECHCDPDVTLMPDPRYGD